MANERSFVMVKPDGVQRGLIGAVISRLEQRGLKLVAMKFLRPDRALAERHYAEHKGKSFYDELIDFITSGPVVAMVWEGDGAVAAIRTMMGATDPQASKPGTIRGDFALHMRHNIVHGSDSLESAEREIGIWFRDDELVEWMPCTEAWL